MYFPQPPFVIFEWCVISILILFYEIHRFTGAAGTMMATQPLRRNHCNTDGSGSLKIASKSNYAPYPEVMIQFILILQPF